MNDIELMDELRRRSGVDNEETLRKALDASARGIGARLPNDITGELAADLPPLLAEPLMSGSTRSPATVNELYTIVGEAADVAVEESLALTQSVMELVAEGSRPEVVEKARAALKSPWSDLLRAA